MRATTPRDSRSKPDYREKFVSYCKPGGAITAYLAGASALGTDFFIQIKSTSSPPGRRTEMWRPFTLASISVSGFQSSGNVSRWRVGVYSQRYVVGPSFSDTSK